MLVIVILVSLKQRHIVMNNKILKDKAHTYLLGSLSGIRSQIDRGNNPKYIFDALREIQIQADFANYLSLISEDEYLELKEKWYHYSELLKNLY